MKELNVYMSSGWFHEADDKICTKLENYLRVKKGVNPYFPRHDGVKLEPGQFHDPNLRKKVFDDNVLNIEKAHFIVTNLDGRTGIQDTGTVWEDGYANARKIPIIAYQDDDQGKLRDHMSSVSNGFYRICTGLEELDKAIDELISVYDIESNRQLYVHNKDNNKVLFISPDNNDDNIKRSTDVANILIEGYNENFKWVDKLSNIDLNSNLDEIFKDVQYMVAVIDDRHPIVSYMMGQAYARNIPVISYTNYDWGVNLMLAVSILQHVKGLESLKDLVHKIKREGISSIDPYDNSGLKVY